MLGAFLSLRHGQEILAGALVALAVAIKAFPLLAIFYFVYRRYWMAATSLVVALFILLFLLANSFSRMAADLERRSRLAARDVAL